MPKALDAAKRLDWMKASNGHCSVVNSRGYPPSRLFLGLLSDPNGRTKGAAHSAFGFALWPGHFRACTRSLYFSVTITHIYKKLEDPAR